MYINPRESTSFIDHRDSTPFTVGELLLEQGSGDVNEDTLSIKNDLFIVCDGATTIGKKPKRNAVSGGQLAAAIVAEVFAENDRSLENMAWLANRRIQEAMIKSSVDLDDRTAFWSTSFAAVRFKGELMEWAQSGDCLVLLIHENGESELLVNPPGHDTGTLQKWKEIGPGVDGSIQDVLALEIATVRNAMNRDYGVLNGEARALDFVNYGVKKTSSVTDILLFTDGLWPPAECPGESLDVSSIISFYKQAGLHGIKDQIRSLQQRDPRCWRYPRFKRFDDISAIALRR